MNQEDHNKVKSFMQDLVNQMTNPNYISEMTTQDHFIQIDASSPTTSENELELLFIIKDIMAKTNGSKSARAGLLSILTVGILLISKSTSTEVYKQLVLATRPAAWRQLDALMKYFRVAFPDERTKSLIGPGSSSDDGMSKVYTMRKVMEALPQVTHRLWVQKGYFDQEIQARGFNPQYAGSLAVSYRYPGSPAAMTEKAKRLYFDKYLDWYRQWSLLPIAMLSVRVVTILRRSKRPKRSKPRPKLSTRIGSGQRRIGRIR